MQELGFSFICKTYQGKQKEFAYMYIKGFNFVSLEREEIKQYQIHIGYLQMDNNAGTIFPIIMWPKDIQLEALIKEQKEKHEPQKEEAKKPPAKPLKPLFNAVVTIKKGVPDSQVIFFHQVKWLLQTLIVQIDDEFIGYLVKFFDDVTSVMETGYTQVHPVFLPEASEEP